jgi:2-oxoglutarate dehydrogenase E2 component (dihydrolipoamide succinyltransferase)
VQTPLQAIKPPAVYGEEHEVIPMDRVRQLISEHMTFSTHTSAHVTSVGEVDVTDIVHLINKHKDDFLKREGIKLTYTPFICRGIIDGVKAYPMVNVSVDGHNIIRHKRINLGIATALEDGNLIVPVIKDADSLSMSGLARSVYDLSMKARTKKLNPDDIIGGTITLTNFGTFSTLFGTPIINQPQAAIIGMGAVQKRAVVREYEGEDVIVIRSMMYLSITFDHRVIDGALGGKCLGAIIKSLEAMNEGNVDM